MPYGGLRTFKFLRVENCKSYNTLAANNIRQVTLPGIVKIHWTNATNTFELYIDDIGLQNNV